MNRIFNIIIIFISILYVSKSWKIPFYHHILHPFMGGEIDGMQEERSAI